MDARESASYCRLIVGAPRDQSPQQREVRKGGRVYRCLTTDTKCRSIQAFELEGTTTSSFASLLRNTCTLTNLSALSCTLTMTLSRCKRYSRRIVYVFPANLCNPMHGLLSRSLGQLPIASCMAKSLLLRIKRAHEPSFRE